jgi:hypothetical protein
MEQINEYFHIVSTLIMLGWLFIGMRIDQKIGRLKETFLKDRIEVGSKIDSLSGTVQTHVAEDRIQFQELQRRLGNIEGR